MFNIGSMLNPVSPPPLSRYQQFHALAKEERKQLASELKHWPSELIPRLTQEQDEEVIEVILKHITDDQFRKLIWQQDDKGYINAIMHGSQVGDPKDICYNYCELSYAYSLHSSISFESFLPWIQHASGKQLFMLLMKTRSFDHVGWILQNMTPSQKQEFKSYLDQLISYPLQFEEGWIKDVGAPGVDIRTWELKLEPLLMEISKYNPLLFEEVIEAHAGHLCGSKFALALYFCSDEKMSYILSIFLSKASLENMNGFLKNCLSNAHDQTYKGVKTRCRFVRMFDLAMTQLQNLSCWQAIQNSFKSIKMGNQDSEFFAQALIEYSLVRPQSYYFAEYISCLKTDFNLLLSFMRAYTIPLGNQTDSEAKIRAIQHRILTQIDNTVTYKEAFKIIFYNLKDRFTSRDLVWFFKFMAEKEEEFVIQLFMEDIRKRVSGPLLAWAQTGRKHEHYWGFKYISYELKKKILERCSQYENTSTPQS